MKLFEKYNRLNITATILTFVVGSFAFYFALNYILIREVDGELVTEQQEIVTYIKLHNTLPEIIPTKEQHTAYAAYYPGNDKLLEGIATVKKKDNNEDEDQREIKFAVTVKGQAYMVTVDKPLEQTEALLQTIIAVTVSMIAMILLVGYFINTTVVRRLWKPFYKTIKAVETYHLSDNSAINLGDTDIEEFSLLNKSINEMMGRIHHDFTALKDFTGQAAHEMQTPLAIIRSKLDMLIQNEALLEKSAQNVTDIEKAVQRLSRLHQSLLLLTKVENRQFLLNEQVDIDKIVADKCAEYSEMAEGMEITLAPALAPATILFHNHLADILINNLINNAIKYNRRGGTVNIVLQHNTLVISNTSDMGKLDTGKIFKPFYRDGNFKEGTGLGLSIAKQICDTAGYTIRYDYANELHILTIIFNSR